MEMDMITMTGKQLENIIENAITRALEKERQGKILNKKEAASTLRCSFPTLQKYIRQGLIIPAKDGRISYGEIDRFKRTLSSAR